VLRVKIHPSETEERTKQVGLLAKGSSKCIMHPLYSVVLYQKPLSDAERNRFCFWWGLRLVRNRLAGLSSIRAGLWWRVLNDANLILSD
jgi:hypothetical protein